VTELDDLHPTVSRWFDEEAGDRAPADLLEAVLEETRGLGQHPAWLATVIGYSMRGSARLATGPGRVLAATVFAGLVLAVGAASFLSAGTSPSLDRPLQAPASLVVEGPECPADGLPEPSPGPLPEIGDPPIERPRNGLLAVTDVVHDLTARVTMLDPGGGDVLATWSGVLATSEAWSPDGRWLVVRSPGPQPPYPWDGCQDLLLISAEGERVVPVTSNALGTQAMDATWSPDGKWLAVAGWSWQGDRSGAFAGSAVDVLKIGADGAVTERRRIWSHAVDWAINVRWGPDGRLAWVVQPQSGSGDDVYVLGPDMTEPVVIPVGDGIFPIRWSTDGRSIVGPGLGVLHVVSVDERRAQPLDLAVDLPSGQSWAEDPVAVSRTGRLYFPADPYAGTDLYSSDLSGRDARALTDPRQRPHPVGVYGPILSPDETLVAFRGGPHGAGGIWVVGSDGSRLRQISTSEWGMVSWQPTP
jgi:hypothetical protein